MKKNKLKEAIVECNVSVQTKNNENKYKMD